MDREEQIVLLAIRLYYSDLSLLQAMESIDNPVIMEALANKMQAAVRVQDAMFRSTYDQEIE